MIITGTKAEDFKYPEKDNTLDILSIDDNYHMQSVDLMTIYVMTIENEKGTMCHGYLWQKEARARAIGLLKDKGTSDEVFSIDRITIHECKVFTTCSLTEYEGAPHKPKGTLRKNHTFEWTSDKARGWIKEEE